jgi:outer membrane receptor for ferrienterochelin and colicins
VSASVRKPEVLCRLPEPTRACRSICHRWPAALLAGALSVLAWLAWPGVLRAQDMGELLQMPVEDLLSVSSVTASGGTSEERATASGNVVIVQRQDIENNGWRSIGEVLASIPGLYVIDDGSLISVGVRGVSGGLRAGTRLVKIMINGTPVSFRPDLRAFIGPEYIPILAVERVEVVKGPLSALYGANAFLATVNVITREIPFGTTVEAAGGFGMSNGAHLGMGATGVATYSGERARMLLGVTAHSLNRSGRSIQKTFAAQNPEEERWRPMFAESSNGDISSPMGGFLQLLLPSKRLGNLTLDAGIQRLDSVAEFQLNSTLTHESRESLLNGWLALKHDRNWNDRFSTQLSIGAAKGQPTHDERFFLTGNMARTFTRNFGYRSLTTALALAYTRERFSARLVLDADLEQEDVLYYTALFNGPQGNRMSGERLDFIPATAERTKNMSDLGVGLQVTGQPSLKLAGLQLTGNVRVDRVSYGGFEPPAQLSTRASLVYRWAPWLVTKVIGGRAFQAPSAILLYAQPGFGVANNLIGNLTLGADFPKLRPQSLSSVEAVAYLLMGDVAAFELSAFYQRLTDKIEFVAAGTDHIARNTGQSSYAGLESTLRLSFWRLAPFFSGNLLRPLKTADPMGPRLASFPEISATAGLDAEVLLAPRIHVNALVRYVGARGATAQNILQNFTNTYELPAYVSTDLNISTGRLSLLGETPKTRFSLSLRNLLDERHSEPGFGGYDVPAAGRSFFFEVQQTF